MNKVIQLKKKAESHIGLPADLKTGIEQLSGYLMDDVKVHYNSSKPAELNAYAYTQGTDIYIASGQEKYLPHEAWHVVQQKQGRVKATRQMNGSLNLNDDVLLEKEATRMGEKALEMKSNMSRASTIHKQESQNIGDVIQLAGTKPNQPSVCGKYRVKLSSLREEYVYNNRVALGLDKILPSNYKVGKENPNNGNKITSIVAKVNEKNNLITLKNPIPRPSEEKRVLCIETVGFNENKGKKLFIDIKIGQYTKSQKQFAIEGARKWKMLLKQAEHAIKDTKQRTSRDTGYDIDAENKIAFNKAIKDDETSITNVMGLVLKELKTIQKTMNDNKKVTFVGASLFIVLDIDTPEASSAKLIDPDHPILLGTSTIGSPPDNLTDKANFDRVINGGKQNEEMWNAYCKRYKDSFNTGMTNFIQRFHDVTIGAQNKL